MSKYFIIFNICFIFLLSSCNESARRSSVSGYNPQSTEDSTETDTNSCSENETLNEETGLCEEVVVEVTRPSNQINVTSYCACQGNQSITQNISTCDSVCSTKSSSSEEKLLYITMQPSEQLQLNESLSTVQKWCRNSLSEESGNNQCAMEIYDESNNLVGTVVQDSDNVNEITNLAITANRLVLRLTSAGLTESQNYRLRLIELESQATWNSFIQLRLKSLSSASFDGIPLWSTPVNQYSCLLRGVATENGVSYFDWAQKMYFYYIEQNRPPTVPAGVDYLICHDYFTTLIDSPSIPRLELVPDIFRVWDLQDPKFSDIRGPNGSSISNQDIDIHDTIVDMLAERGVTQIGSPNIFNKIQAQFFPSTTLAENSDNQIVTGEDNSTLGYIMRPFIDQATNMSYCPNQTHYYSSVPIMRVLKEVVGSDTEGLYFAESEIVTSYEVDGTAHYSPQSFMFIKESTLKKIWFYIDSNSYRVSPTESNVRGKTVYFFWPPNPNSPFVKGANQRTYTVKGPDIYSAAADAANGNDPPPTSIATHDKKIGCVPSTEDQD